MISNTRLLSTRRDKHLWNVYLGCQIKFIQSNFCNSTLIEIVCRSYRLYNDFSEWSNWESYCLCQTTFKIQNDCQPNILATKNSISAWLFILDIISTSIWLFISFKGL